MKIIHMADIHIDQRKTVNGRIIEDPATSLNIRMKDLADCMDKVASFAAQNGCDLFLIAGDIFERPIPLPIEYLWAMRLLTKLTGTAPVVAVAGNHDGEKAARILSFLRNVTVLDPFEEFTMGDLRVIGIPYPDPKVYQSFFPGPNTKSMEECLRERLKTVSRDGRFTIALGHTNIATARTPSGREVVGETTLTPKDLSGFDYAAWGHIHRAQVIGKVHYPGSLDIQNYDEKDEKKGFFYLDTATGKADFIEIHTRPVKTFHFTYPNLPTVSRPDVRDAICKVTVEISESDFPALNQEDLTKYFPDALDVDVCPQVVHHQRIRAESAKGATGIMDYLNVYLEAHPEEDLDIDRIKKRIRELCTEAGIACTESRDIDIPGDEHPEKEPKAA
ncbi:MAG TPA: hypothetical protein ENN18_01620 [Proteobacteria bacterium]|nr:hypothetical protein [Pseudomonadota bacterium]